MTRAAAAFFVLVIGVATALVYLRNPDTPDFVQRLRYPLEYRQIVRGHARNYDLEPALLAAVIYQESKFDADAVSASGAVGLMQLLPSTGQGIADRTGGDSWKPEDLRNPELNVRYGSWYLRHLLDKYEDEELALAAYNAGQANVERWSEQGVGIQFDETRHYVERVQELKEIYARNYAAELGLS